MKKNKIIKRLKENNNIQIYDLIIFSIVFVVFVISLLSFFPAILTSDCVDQINQAMTNNYCSSHPIIHSFIIGNLAKLGGTWVPALFQINVFAFIWTYACKSLRKYNQSNLNKAFQIVFTTIICIIPLNYMYSITLWKDILYSYAILLLLILIFIGIKESFKYTNIQMILIAISSVSIMMFRKNGLPIGLLMFLMILILNFIKNRDKKDLIKMISSFVLLIIIMKIPELVVNNVGGNDGNVLNSTKIFCFGALLNDGIEIEEEEKEFLNTILDLNEWKEKFNPYNGTPILFSNNINNDTLKNIENEKRFNEIFIKYALQRKKVVANHFVKINSIWWSIKELGGMNSIVLSNEWISEMSNGIYDNKPIIENKIMLNLANFTLSKKILYVMLYRPALAMYISIVIGAIIIIKGWKNNEKEYILLIFPMILNIGTYIILISSQDHRYFYPSHLTEYFLILIFISSITENIERKGKIKLEKNEKI